MIAIKSEQKFMGHPESINKRDNFQFEGKFSLRLLQVKISLFPFWHR